MIEEWRVSYGVLFPITRDLTEELKYWMHIIDLVLGNGFGAASTTPIWKNNKLLIYYIIK